MNRCCMMSLIRLLCLNSRKADGVWGKSSWGQGEISRVRRGYTIPLPHPPWLPQRRMSSSSYPAILIPRRLCPHPPAPFPPCRYSYTESASSSRVRFVMRWGGSVSSFSQEASSLCGMQGADLVRPLLVICAQIFASHMGQASTTRGGRSSQNTIRIYLITIIIQNIDCNNFFYIFPVDYS